MSLLDTRGDKFCNMLNVTHKMRKWLESGSPERLRQNISTLVIIRIY